MDIKEKDLYLPVQEYLNFNGWTVKGEVNYCDIAAVKQDRLLIVELKLCLNLDVILQAVKRQKQADMVYIAVPKKSRQLSASKWRETCELLKRLGIGLFVVRVYGGGYVEELHQAKEYSIKRNIKQRNKTLKEMESRKNDLNIGGVNNTKIITAYMEECIKIAFFLKKYNELSPKQLKMLGTEPNKTYSILRRNFYGWFESEKRGIYKITQKGIKDLEKYTELIEKLELDM